IFTPTQFGLDFSAQSQQLFGSALARSVALVICVRASWQRKWTRLTSFKSMKTPLSVLVVRHGPLADSEHFVSALRKALLGSDVIDAYAAADYELLNPVDFREFSSPGKARDFQLLMPNEEK